MAAAVAEARRVLKPGGILLDIHPTDEPNLLQVWHARYKLNGELSDQPENLDAIHRAPVGEFDHAPDALGDFAAATDALAEALETETGFELTETAAFDYRYFFDSLDELTEYLEDEWESVTASEAVLERALMVMQQATTTPKLVAAQRTVVTVLRKI